MLESTVYRQSGNIIEGTIRKLAQGQEKESKGESRAANSLSVGVPIWAFDTILDGAGNQTFSGVFSNRWMN